MKKVNFNVAFMDFTGNPMTQEVKEGNTVTTKEIKIKNLLANKIGGMKHETDFEKTLMHFELASKIVKAEGEIPLKTEEVEVIKNNLTELPVLMAGQILQLLK